MKIKSGSSKCLTRPFLVTFLSADTDQSIGLFLWADWKKSKLSANQNVGVPINIAVGQREKCLSSCFLLYSVNQRQHYCIFFAEFSCNGLPASLRT